MGGENRLFRCIHGKLRVRSLDEAIWLLAERQHGVVARWQLLEMGFPGDAIDRATDGYRLLRLHRGVFAVGHGPLTREGRWMAACLAAGRPAILSHLSGAHLLIVVNRSPTRIAVTLPGNHDPYPALQRHGSALTPDEVTTRAGIPVTTPIRTLVDIAPLLPLTQLERVTAKATHLGLLRPADLDAALTRYAGRRGIARLRAVHATGHACLGATASPLEDDFLPFLDAHDLPRPELNVPLTLSGTHIVVDCLWRDARVACELDSHTHHGDWAAAESDRARDRLLTTHSYKPIRVTRSDLARRATELASQLRALLSPGARA